MFENLFQSFARSYSLRRGLSRDGFLESAILLHQFRVAQRYDYLENIPLPAAGSAKYNAEDAFVATLGEMLEREDLRYSKKEIYSGASYRDIYGAIATDEIENLQGFHDFQFHLPNFRYHKWTADSKTGWAEGRRLISDERIFLPQGLIQIAKGRFFESTSNGCALAESADEAILKALYELIERDLVMRLWWNREEPKFVDLRSLAKKKSRHFQYIFGPWLKQISLAQIPNQFGVACYLAIFSGENKKEQPAWVMASACHHDPEVAANGALSEMGGLLNRSLTQFHLIQSRPIIKSGNFELDVRSFADHHHLYTFDITKEFMFFKCPQEGTKSFVDFQVSAGNASVESRLKRLKERLHKCGYNPIIVNQTSKSTGLLGFNTFRALDSKMIGINSMHSTRRWGNTSLQRREKDLSLLNPFPHPFA